MDTECLSLPETVAITVDNVKNREIDLLHKLYFETMPLLSVVTADLKVFG